MKNHIEIHTILNSKNALTLSGVAAGFTPLLLADIARASKGRAVYIAADEMTMRSVAQSVPYFAKEVEILQYPAWDCLPYDRASPSLNITSERMATLQALQLPIKESQLLVTTIGAVIQKNISPFRVRQTGESLEPGHIISRERIAALLQSNGYYRVDTVAEPGEFAMRGNLVDLFPSGLEHGIRLDFFGDELESIRKFNTENQRTTGRMDRLDLYPAVESCLDKDAIRRFRTAYRERHGAHATSDPLYQAISEGRRLAGMDHWLPLLEDKMVPLFDHLSRDDIILRDKASHAAAEQRFDSIKDYYQNRVRVETKEIGSYRPLEPEQLYLNADECDSIYAERPVHLLSNFDEPKTAKTLSFSIKSGRDFAPERAQKTAVYGAVNAHIKALKKSNSKTVIANYSDGARSRMLKLMSEDSDNVFAQAASWQEAQAIATKGATAMIVLALDHGFAAPDVSLITEQDILGDRLVRRRKNRKSADAFLAELSALAVGDLVVHVDHGIGRYEGLSCIEVGTSPHDCVSLTYAGGDKLFVPVENIDVLSRYGASGDTVPLDKLGGEAWQRRKSKLKERIRAIAHELMKTAALRALRSGQAIDLDESAYNEFINRFPYQETEDQERVIQEVLDDLSSGKPMDRLVCGDVGFGKTEVALRAAFAAALSGMQVAIIAPTTLLARQHYNGFVERFRDLPFNIGRLSRLVSAKEASKTRAGLADGTIDIVIGTHALLAKTIDFKRLGLVIVDEEQRFGVTHKERLKALKTDVHMLTLTATPIPRTLQMAMSGLRELSVIQTPPVDRLAVRTYVMPWDAIVIKEALLREHYRGGQSFFVVPRISDLTSIEDYLREEIPEIKYISAHGQMAPADIEERMNAFYDKKYDILLSTTIVESGLDIPSANTMIIHRADRFGLAQLYQLRGRVGRSKTRAYAYLTTEDDRILTETAEKRLKVLSDLDTLGGGFQLASHDLDIRGAGNLVGDEQSGHIKEVGFELYQAMLEDAILEARAHDQGLAKAEASFSPQITIDAPILIPEDYVPDLPVRMGLYRRLNTLENREELESFAAEMTDRFGELPEPTSNLLRLIEIKQNALKACVTKIEIGPRGALISFQNDTPPDINGLLSYVQKLGQIAKLRPDSKLVISRVWRDPQSRLKGCLQLSKGLLSANRKAFV